MKNGSKDFYIILYFIVYPVVLFYFANQICEMEKRKLNEGGKKLTLWRFFSF